MNIFLQINIESTNATQVRNKLSGERLVCQLSESESKIRESITDLAHLSAVLLQCWTRVVIIP